MRQGVARRSACFSRLQENKVSKLYLQSWPAKKKKKGKRNTSEHVPTLNEVLEVLAPFDFLVGLVLQLGDWLADDVRQQIDKTSTWLHFRAVRREGEAVLRDLKQCNAEGPDVGCDGVRLPCDTFGSHVVRCADESVGIALGAELTTHTKVAELDIATTREEDVAGLDVTVDDAAGVKVGEAIENAFSHLP